MIVSLARGISGRKPWDLPYKMGVKETLQEVLTAHGGGSLASAADVADYIVGMLEDEDFEFGENGEAAFDSIGPFMQGPHACKHAAVTAGAPAGLTAWPHLHAVWMLRLCQTKPRGKRCARSWRNAVGAG